MTTDNLPESPRLTPLTEDQIERRVERVMDALDARLMSGKLSQADYDWEVKSLAAWAERKYDETQYNRELALRIRHTGPNGILPPRS